MILDDRIDGLMEQFNGSGTTFTAITKTRARSSTSARRKNLPRRPHRQVPKGLKPRRIEFRPSVKKLLSSRPNSRQTITNSVATFGVGIELVFVASSAIMPDWRPVAAKPFEVMNNKEATNPLKASPKSRIKGKLRWESKSRD